MSGYGNSVMGVEDVFYRAQGYMKPFGAKLTDVSFRLDTYRELLEDQAAPDARSFNDFRDAIHNFTTWDGLTLLDQHSQKLLSTYVAMSLC